MTEDRKGNKRFRGRSSAIEANLTVALTAMSRAREKRTKWKTTRKTETTHGMEKKKKKKPAGRGRGRVGGIVTARRLKKKVKVVSVSSRGRTRLAKRRGSGRRAHHHRMMMNIRGRRDSGRRPARDGAGEYNCNRRSLAEGIRRRFT